MSTNDEELNGNLPGQLPASQDKMAAHPEKTPEKGETVKPEGDYPDSPKNNGGSIRSRMSLSLSQRYSVSGSSMKRGSMGSVHMPDGIRSSEAEPQTIQQKAQIVLRESVISVVMIVAIICVVVVQFSIIDRITAASVSTQSALIAADVEAQITVWLREKTSVVKHHEFVYRSGQFNARDMIVHPRFAEVDDSTLLPNPDALRNYEAMTVPFFANDIDLVALYNAMSHNQTWKVHQEKPPMITTQLRYAGTISATNSTPFFERYERQRGHDDEVENFVLAKHKLKRYQPTEQGWYQDASAAPFNATTQTYEALWQGPTFQGLGAGSNDNYGLEPVMTYLKKVMWKDTTKFSVFKLKILTNRVNAMLQRLQIPGTSDIALVNNAGDIAGYRQPATQVIPDAEDPSNPKKATLAKVWAVPRFSGVVTAESLAIEIPGQGRVDLGSGVSLFTVPNLPGFRIVIYLNGDELVAPYRPYFDAILGLATLLIALGFVAIVYSSMSVQRHMAEASNATLGRLLSDLLPGPIAQKVVNRVVWPITDKYKTGTVFFADIVNFTARSARADDPIDIVVMLNCLVEMFDNLSTKHNVEKIKTIGDCYMAVSGAPVATPSHASSMLRFAFAVLDAIAEFNGDIDITQDPVFFRIGVHSGSFIGAVIGARRFLFDVFGPTVNIASRVESISEAQEIRTTLATRKCVEGEGKKVAAEFEFVDEEDVNVKGVPEAIRCYFVRKSENGLDQSQLAA